MRIILSEHFYFSFDILRFKIIGPFIISFNRSHIQYTLYFFYNIFTQIVIKNNCLFLTFGQAAADDIILLQILSIVPYFFASRGNCRDMSSDVKIGSRYIHSLEESLKNFYSPFTTKTKIIFMNDVSSY